MARSLVTACLFCLLCATHTSCESHYNNDIPELTLDTHHRIEDKRLQLKNERYHHKLNKIRSHRYDNELNPAEDIRFENDHTDIVEDSRVDRRKRHAEDSSDEYIEQIFRLYGNPESMTMNLTGFNQMLEVLDLHKMIEGGVQKVRSLKTAGEEETVRCVDSGLLISTVNQQSELKTPHGHDHDHSHTHSNDHPENQTNPLTITAETIKNVCPILLFQKVANTSLQRTGCIQEHAIKRRSEIEMAKTENAYSKNMFQVWLYSSLSIIAISACGLFGVAVIPIMHKTYYNHLLQFLVALAVGTLCGDALLHLLPHAMSPMDDNPSNYSHDDGMWKGLAAMLGVVFFYFMEKGLTVIVEWRKRRQKLKEDKLPSRVRVLKDDCSGGSTKAPFTSSSLMKVFKKEDKSEGSQKTCKHKYSEYPYCYDEIETDTHDDHHMRDGQVPPSPKNKAVSVVSSNALNQESKESDPTAKDWLLKPESGLGVVEMNNIKHKDDGKELKEEGSYTVILREHSRNHHGHSHSHGHVHAPPSSMSSVAWMVIMGDGLHNFTDGMAIGAAFASNIAGGFSTAIAVLCHELPHELGDFAVLLKAGMSVRRAVCYNVLSSALCLAGMVCGVLAGHAPSATRWLFAIAAGTFLYIALVDMMPELSTSHSKEGTLCQCILQLMGLATGIGIMLVIALYEHDLKNLFG